ncbi:MAG: CoA transferase [Deltaproteobacteria bacterium]|nr:MAG: CoA transferase [Deltaproteobacteria bacterium]
MKALLHGVRVLDLTRMLAGPYCTLLLADMGAEVIKIERPGKGDEIRRMGPPFVKGVSAYFISVNRNKLSLTLDLKSPKGKEIFLKLVEKADVVIDNFRPGVMSGLGFDYETLKSINPKIVACSISGYGQTGPYRDRPAYDLVLQAMGGVVALTGEPGSRPVRCGVPIGDLAGAMQAAFSIVSALFARERTGEGACLDISLLDSLVFLAPYIAQYYFADGKVMGPSGSKHRSVTPYQIFESADGYLVVAVFGEGFWPRFCQAIGRPELADDPRFKTNLDRVKHREILDPLLEDLIKTRPTKEWLAALERHQIPSCEVKTIDKVLTDPQLLSRGMIGEMDHPVCGTVKTLANPVKIEGIVSDIRHAPLLGEHTNELLSRILNLTPSEIVRLREGKVV